MINYQENEIVTGVPSGGIKMTEQEKLKEAENWLIHVRKLASTHAEDEIYRKRLATLEWLVAKAKECLR